MDELVQIVDRVMAEAVRKSGSWLACRIGCHECCLGPFSITQLDGLRLRAGLAELRTSEPVRAARVLDRARAYVETDDEPCPALDPETGACDLYAARPITCRMFGPAVRQHGGQSLGVCELCFRGATDEEIAACAVEVDPDNLEAVLLRELERTTGACGDTTVAFALARYDL
jgi:Fe-S-cluster containining protein